MLSHELIRNYQLFSKYKGHSLEAFESILKTSKRHILADIAKINDTLSLYQLPLIALDRQLVYPPDLTEKNLLNRMLPTLDDYLFQDERLDMIIIYIMMAKEFISINHLESLLRLSRNSVIADLNLVRDRVQAFQVTLAYNRQDGYFFEGEPLALRRLLESSVSSLLQVTSGPWVFSYLLHELGLPDQTKVMAATLEELSRENHLTFISEKLRDLIYFFCLLAHRPFSRNVRAEAVDTFPLASPAVETMVDQLLVNFPSLTEEKYLVQSRLLGCIQGDLDLVFQQLIYDIMEEIINSVAVNTGLSITDTPELRQNLYSHLLPAYYRLYYDINLTNPLKEQIKQDYESLFYLVKRSLSPLEKQLGKSVNEDEVAYFTIHFGRWLQAPKKRPSNQLVALSVCPNGISSSLMLEATLKELFPQLQFIRIHQLDKIKLLDPASFDLIFSTVAFDCAKPVYVTQALMGPVEKMMLKKMVCDDFHLPLSEQFALDDLLSIIHKHTTITNKEGLVSDLSRYLIGNHLTIEKGGLGLLDLLTADFIRQADAVSDWQEAIRLAAQPLLEHQMIETSYIDGMIDSVNELGAYIVLAPKVAVPHAAPEKGTRQLGMSLLQLKEPVSFDLKQEGDPDKQVQLIFVLSAVDSSSHLKALQELSLILDDDEHIEQLIEAENTDKIMSLISHMIEKGDESHD
ncbi:BglG family transcription antiterminator [Streptococcus pyogenes]|uniref:BglG family transcription antiterminator n=1 Tax=Streptococcus pyogenes TaxID=1314 RepID=UPI00109BCEAD|nr:BglG family transcription antiterminator [Streptococcus pyogenes]VGR69425.1 PTS system mannitol (cryptic)-specific transporter subunit IIA [Streptococcus pyogenes]VGR99860.1 PTS system mannitol (cryptic)-specific transporter subunit IIA [Streptococcus pyogenes]VHC80401.1 PTS system mannitol (cryptic)-specific transporter subunit IIA [Streptococcus pyogenes]HER6554303.1 BglG family transcription antiterminator [Streptococcus pyogenes]HES9438438.1 BglG family transcription antiterminator [Str